MNKDQGEEGGFLSRWSRRKAQVQVQAQDTKPGASAAPAADPSAVTAQQAAAAAALPAAAAPVASAAAAPSDSPAPVRITPVPQADGNQAPAGPTLGDVERLDAASDYRAFVGRDVDPQVRNAAFKKMFHSDPHFNVMDGLDVYIDDYNTPQPLSLAVMKTLVQARALGLIDDELKEQELPVVSGESSEAIGSAVADAGSPDAAEDAGPGEQAAAVDGSDTGRPHGSAEIVHVMHVVPAESVWPAVVVAGGDAANAAQAPLSAAPTPAAAAGSVVPFPRRPGSADPA